MAHRSHHPERQEGVGIIVEEELEQENVSQGCVLQQATPNHKRLESAMKPAAHQTCVAPTSLSTGAVGSSCKATHRVLEEREDGLAFFGHELGVDDVEYE